MTEALNQLKQLLNETQAEHSARLNKHLEEVLHFLREQINAFMECEDNAANLCDVVDHAIEVVKQCAPNPASNKQ